MLILDRNPGQKIIIGDDITVLVCGVISRTNEVKIGIRVPKNIKVKYKEGETKNGKSR